ncbi:Ig-like domain-containing protein [Clostridium felsineum]|uniref:Ig-like domain-containing protein n=1 Tax=Clostridium felsineum TaxID=36839 RepID=UPI00098C264F|nr:Ig-like domain-containing protein [Clostridium felsineum]URZ14618.1 hypothetical protein CLFE_006150 [Clostridium felsineum DSM 794]
MKKLNSRYLLVFLTCFIIIFAFNTNDTFKAETTVGVTYQTHVQNIGWQPWVSDGAEGGTDGQALRVEALKIKLQNAPTDAKITYQAHVQNIGWQSWTSNGEEAGTDGQALRVEVLRIKLENMPDYSVEYQAHVQNVGWQDWVKDGEEAGTDGQALRVEALRIKLVKKVHPDSISLNKATDNLKVGDNDTLQASLNPDNTTDKNVSWSSSDSNIVSVANGKITALAGGTATITATSNDGQKTASCSVTVAKADPTIEYQTHVQNIGWQPWVYNGDEAGTDGQALRVEALRIKLQNAPADAKIEYQTHVQNIGWQSWMSNGDEAGTDGQALRIEALKIKLENMPGYFIEYQAHVQNVGWQPWVRDGMEAGTDGQGLRVEALRIKLCKVVPVQSISLNKSTDTLDSGDNDVLSVNFNPSDATNKNVTWSSSDSSIVSVDNTGKLTAMADGDGTASATITATSSDRQKIASCLVTVNKKPSISFKDSALETVVRKAISKNSGKLYQKDVANIRTIDGANQGIHYLDGIENLSNLKFLSLPSNAISDLTPIKNLTNLQGLSLDNNNVSDINCLSNLTNLTALSLDSNPITDISSTANLSRLQLLSLCNDYSIKNINIVSNLNTLLCLVIPNTNLTDISFLNNLKNLQELYLAQNHINNFSTIYNLTNLTDLDISNTDASEAQVKSLQNALPNCEIYSDYSADSDN